MICPLCNREIVHLSKHHPIPKSLGGVKTIDICGDCHSAIHGRYTNKTLKEKLYDLEQILADPDLQKTFKFLSKKDPARRFKTRRSKKKPGKGKI